MIFLTLLIPNWGNSCVTCRCPAAGWPFGGAEYVVPLGIQDINAKKRYLDFVEKEKNICFLTLIDQNVQTTV